MMALSTKAKSLVGVAKQLSASKEKSDARVEISHMEEDHGNDVVFPSISKMPSVDAYSSASIPSYMSLSSESCSALIHNPEVEDMIIEKDDR
jgi:hypothetical protein